MPPSIGLVMRLPAAPWFANLTPILETALDAVVVMKEDGSIADWNSLAEATFGWSASDAIGKQLSGLIIPHRYREDHQRGLERYLATGDGPLINRHVEISALRSSGDEFPVELSITATEVSGKRLFIGFLRDISKRKAAENALRQSEARLAATYNHALVGIAETDRSGRLMRSNDQFSVMTGYSSDELQAKTFFDITHPDDLEEDRRLFNEQWSGVRTGYTVEKRYIRKDGAVMWVEVAASLVTGEEGSEPFAIRILRDITDRKRAEEQQRLLLNELNHRVKNTLAVVQGLAYQTFKGSGISAETRRLFEGRLGALAAAHNLLMQHTWEPTPISGATETALKPFYTSRGRIRFAGPEILLTPSATVTLTLALHELATNAAKYGALANEEGEIEIRWAIDDGRLTFTWREEGGPPVEKPTRTGFGTRLLEKAVARDLGAQLTLDFAPAGIVCTISAPLARLTP
jgi:PAS domain S-box-containing protein